MILSRRTTYTPNTLIDADIHNLEHDDYVVGINQSVKNIGDEVIAGSKGFSSVPYTTGGDPATDNALARKAYVDSRDAGIAALFKGFSAIAPPVYASASTFTVSSFNVRNSLNNGNISKTTSTTVDISTAGMNGDAQSGALVGTVGTGGSPSTTITGSSTKFLTDFMVGDVLWTGSGARRITAIASDTSLTVESSVTLANGTSYKRGGEAPNTWYNLYAVTDGTTPGLLLSTRNLSKTETLADLPYSASSSLTGTIATTTGAAVITGTGTLFLSEYEVGDNITITDGNQLTVASISDNLTMTATANASVTVSGKAHARVRYKVRQLPLTLRNDGSSNLIPFQVGQGWPCQPLVLFRDFDYTSAYIALSSGNATTAFTNPGGGTNVNLNSLVPPTSKTALIFAQTAYSSGSGTFFSYVKSPDSASTTGQLAGLCNHLGESYMQNYIFISLNASQQLAYRVDTATINLSLYVNGYIITEVT